jgi:two-component system secretion system response regulator SalR
MSKDPPRILIVEDSKLTAEQICELISKSYPEVKCSVVSTENEALSAMAENSPDVIVLDLHLAKGTGFGVLKQMDALEKRPLVIVMTNYALPQYRDFALLRGANYFLDKAVSMYELPNILRSFISASG